MAYRKIRADRIFDGNKFLDNEVLVVSDNGNIESIIPDAEAGEDIETIHGILTPGFVNCHCHLELSHMKGLIPEKTGLVDFVFKIITQRHQPEDEIKNAIDKAEEEMYNNGIVAVGDICNNESTLLHKKRGKLSYYNFIEASGWLPGLSDARISRALQLYKEYNNGFDALSIVPHAPYSVSENLWQRIQPYFENRTVSIHNQETVFEDQFFREGKGDFIRMYELMKINNDHHRPSGTSSLQSFYSKLEKAESIILVHNTFTTQEDLDFIRKKHPNELLKTFFCLCVNANLYIENAVPPVQMLRTNQCQIVLGTDSLASNKSLSIVNEINTIRSHFPHIPFEEILQWATSNGAKALGMQEKFGHFKKGTAPGINLLSEHENEISVKRIK